MNSYCNFEPPLFPTASGRKIVCMNCGDEMDSVQKVSVKLNSNTVLKFNIDICTETPEIENILSVSKVRSEYIGSRSIKLYR